MARRTDRRSNDAPPASAVIVAQPVNARDAYDKIKDKIAEREDDIVRTLAPTIPRERFLNIALQAITRSPKLLECTPASFVLALRDAAELGLEPSGLMGQAYLVPFRNKDSGRMEAKLIPGYRGLIDLARRSGEIGKVEARMVRQRDAFDYEFGTSQFIHHRPYLNLTGETEPVIDENGLPLRDERGEPVTKVRDGGPYVAAYVMVALRNGEMLPDMMTVAELNLTRRRSRAADDGPWVSDYGEMGKKTITRRALKYAPFSLTSQLNRALELEDEAESTAGATIVQPATARARFLAQIKGESTTPEEQPDERPDEQPATDEPDAAPDEPAEGEPSPEADELADLEF